MKKKSAIIYLNQFFGQVGGEKDADYKPEIFEGAKGAAAAYQQYLGGYVEITHTVICGDNYVNSNPENAVKEIIDKLKNISFDLFFAGPAFIAGRYGVACGTVGKQIGLSFHVPVFTSMNEENPGVDMFHKDMYIFKGGKSAATMRKDVSAICKYALKYINT